jgi:hypothetical protein
MAIDNNVTSALYVGVCVVCVFIYIYLAFILLIILPYPEVMHWQSSGTKLCKYIAGPKEERKVFQAENLTENLHSSGKIR